MIKYETAKSSFFAKNKSYCENILKYFENQKIDLDGFCNSFGYELKTGFIRNNLNFTMRFIKNQTTQNGVLSPVNANEYAGIEMIINGILPDIKLKVGKSPFLRNFCSKEIKDKIPKPYYVGINKIYNPSFPDKLIEIILENTISKITMNKNKIQVKIEGQHSNPEKLISDIEEIIKNVP